MWRGFRRFPPARMASLFFCLAILCLATACGDSGKDGGGKRAAPVRLAVTETRDIPRVVEAVGNVEPHISVAVKPQVGGQIIEVPVLPGQNVAVGQVLFRLDPRPFEAAVAEAKARLARDVALLDKARKDLARYTTLLKQDVISREAYDQMATAEKTASANIEGDEAALQAAELNLDYSVIRAPAGGKLGDILVRVGNVIKANDDRTLVVINSIKPAEVQFTVAERNLPVILNRMREGGLSVSVLPEGDTGSPVQGRVKAVDNAVDRTTGSIRMYALCDNDDERLWPGQFVRVSLILDTIKDAVLIPDRAVLEGMNGQYVYLAHKNEDGLYTVDPRDVKTDKGPEGFAVVLSGLSPGDVVVTHGQLGLAPRSLARDLAAGGQEQ